MSNEKTNVRRLSKNKIQSTNQTSGQNSKPKSREYYKVYLKYVNRNSGWYDNPTTLEKVAKVYRKQTFFGLEYETFVGRINFPVLTEEINGKLYDIITGWEYCYCSKNELKNPKTNGILYYEKEKCSIKTVAELLKKLDGDKEGLRLYKQELYKCYEKQLECYKKELEEPKRIKREQEANERYVENFRKRYRNK